jgi:GT2 family glycosyltransferase
LEIENQKLIRNFKLGNNLDVSVVIVNYNVKEFVQNLLYSLEKALRNIEAEIIIVDNASDDGSVELIREKFPYVRLVASPQNLGFGKANNLGFQMAKGKYLFILNPDTLVREDTLDKLISFFERTPEAGMIGCKILNPDGTLQLSCRRGFPSPWNSFCKVTGLSSLFPKSRIFAKYNLTYLDEDEINEVDALSGSCMLMRKEAYDKTGGFDEQFFMYGEDLDLCYRVQKAGYKVFYVPETQIIHYKGESTKRSSLDETKVFYGAMSLFVKKHFSSSFLLELVLRSAINITRFFAFLAAKKNALFSLAGDFCVFNVTLYLAQKIYYSSGSWYGFPRWSLKVVYIVPALLYLITAAFIGVYKKEKIAVLKNIPAVLLTFIAVSTMTFFFKQFAFSRAVIIFTFIILMFALPAWRLVLKFTVKMLSQGRSAVRTVSVVIGATPAAAEIAKKLKAKHTRYYSVAGLISITRKEIGTKIGNFEVIGSIETLKKIIKEKKISEVIFSSEGLSYMQIMEVVSSCRNENAEFKLAGNNLDFIVGKTSVSLIDDVPLIGLNYNIAAPVQLFVKSVFDFLLALFLMIFVYPFYKSYKFFNRTESDFNRFISGIPGVLSGRMSFVGPQKPVNNLRLFLGKQGLTGLWYVEEEPDSENLDIFYAKNQSLWLDMEIIGKSINLMLSKRK